MNNRVFAISGIICCLIVLIATAGEIYKWTDENGITQFSDTPPGEASYTEVNIQINSYESPTIVTSTNSTGLSSNAVTMYSTSWCPYCEKARQYFASKGIRYREYDIEKSKKGKRAYDKLGGRGVPVILVGDQRLNGFSVGAFEQIYN